MPGKILTFKAPDGRLIDVEWNGTGEPSADVINRARNYAIQQYNLSPELNSAISENKAPYKYGGNDAESGYDCSSAMCQLAKSAGINLPRTASEQFSDKRAKAIDRANLAPGDLVFFPSTGKSGWHVGMYVGGNKFIHQSTDKNPGLSTADFDAYTRKYGYRGARRYEGLNRANIPNPEKAVQQVYGPTTNQGSTNQPIQNNQAWNPVQIFRDTVKSVMPPATAKKYDEVNAELDRKQEQGLTQTEIHKQIDGSIENAMMKIDNLIGARINEDQRRVIKNYLSSFPDGKITGAPIQMALMLAGAGQYTKLTALANPQATVNKLPFRIDDYVSAVINKQQWIDTKAGGKLSINSAKGQVQKILGLSDDEIADSKFTNKMLAQFALSTQPGVKQFENLKGWQRLLAENAPTADGFAGYLQTFGSMWRVAPEALQSGAGLLLGIDPDTLVDLKEVQENEIGKFGKGAFQIGKYFIPYVGQAALASDVLSIGGRSIEVGPGQAIKEVGQGMLESANVFAPGIGPGERASRGMNALLLAYGVSSAARGAYRAGANKLAVVNELAGKLNITKVEAYKLLAQQEKWTANFIKQQEALGGDLVASAEFVNMFDAYSKAQESKGPIAVNQKSARETGTLNKAETVAGKDPLTIDEGFVPSPDGRLVPVVVASPKLAELNARLHDLNVRKAKGEITEAEYKAEKKNIEAGKKEARQEIETDEVRWVEVNPEMAKAIDEANAKYRENLEFIDDLEGKGEISHEAALREKTKEIVALHKQHREITGHTLLDETTQATEPARVMATERTKDYHSRPGAMPKDEPGTPTLPGENTGETIDYTTRTEKLSEAFHKGEDRPIETVAEPTPSPSIPDTPSTPQSNPLLQASPEPVKPVEAKTWFDKLENGNSEAIERLKNPTQYKGKGIGSGLGGLDPQFVKDLVTVAAYQIAKAGKSIGETVKHLIDEYKLNEKNATDIAYRGLDKNIRERSKEMYLEGKTEAEIKNSINTEYSKHSRKLVENTIKNQVKYEKASFTPTHTYKNKRLVKRGDEFYDIDNRKVNVPEGKAIELSEANPSSIQQFQDSLIGIYDRWEKAKIDNDAPTEKASIDELLQAEDSLRSHTKANTDNLSAMDVEQQTIKGMIEAIESISKSEAEATARIIEYVKHRTTGAINSKVENDISTAIVNLKKARIEVEKSQAAVDNLPNLQQRLSSQSRPGISRYFEHIKRDDAKTLLDISKAKQAKAINDLVQAAIEAQSLAGWDRFIGFWKGGLIGTVGNFAINLKSNFFTSLGLTMSKPARVFTDWIVSKNTGMRTRVMDVKSWDAITNAVSKETGKAMIDALKGKASTADFAKYEASRQQYRGDYTGKGGKANQIVDKTTDFLFGITAAPDRPFRAFAYQKSIGEQATAYAKNMRLKGAEAKAVIDDLTNNPTPWMKITANVDADFAVMAGRNYLAEVIYQGKEKLKRSDNIGAKSVGRGLDIIMAFVKIPLNLANMTVRPFASPITAIAKGYNLKNVKAQVVKDLGLKQSKEFGESLKTIDNEIAAKKAELVNEGGIKTVGQLSLLQEELNSLLKRKSQLQKGYSQIGRAQAELSDLIGDSITAAGLFALGYIGYSTGTITPFRPGNQYEYNKDDAMGKVQGGVSIGGKDIDLTESYVGRILGLGATLNAYLSGDLANQDGETDLNKVIGGATAGAFENPLTRGSDFISKTMKEGFLKGGETFVKSILTPPGLLYETALVISPEMPVTEKSWLGILDNIKNRIPGWRGFQNVKTDVLGQIQDKQFTEKVFGYTENANNPVASLLDELKIPFSAPSKAKKQGDEDKSFDRNEADYQYRVAFVGAKVQEAMGEVLSDEEFNNDLTKAQELAKSSDAKKQAEGKAMMESLRSYLKKFITGVRKDANAELNDMRERLGYVGSEKELWQFVLSKQVKR